MGIRGRFERPGKGEIEAKEIPQFLCASRLLFTIRQRFGDHRTQQTLPGCGNVYGDLLAIVAGRAFGYRRNGEECQDKQTEKDAEHGRAGPTSSGARPSAQAG
ncbi:hypothetical protein GMPD_11720 [Geomonas paludis]|uniref:Uncharacterized protein n=1 Tax=Geomonas paludis TaxID=2740185 RepID=A0A6V8MUL4_9BACT|nr:hypothetical protein GMPD_11720 [Geomonas paludis]